MYGYKFSEWMNLSREKRYEIRQEDARKKHEVQDRIVEARKKVREVFKRLRKKNLICRMNYLCCMSCASHNLGQKIKDTDIFGAVYFHRQDNDGFLEDGYLNIRYFGNDDEKTEMVGQIVQNELVNAGLDPIWDGDPSQTIAIDVSKES